MTVPYVTRSAGNVPDGSISTAELADGSVTAVKVAADVATQAELDAAIAAAPRVLDRVGLLEVVSTLAETTFYTFTVSAGTLSTTRAVRLSLIGDYLNNSGVARRFTLRVKYGATTVFDDVVDYGGAEIPTSAARRPLRLEVLLGNQGATNTQALGGRCELGVVSTATSGTGDLSVTSGAAIGSPAFSGTATEDSTAAKVFAVTVTHDETHASLSLRRQYAVLELI